ncbi:MAG TPA: hypothetical protein VI339_03635, partial [Steroidobacteraceae bacterium]|nr:hypothetical protein [Steroidobacteraceae bacterium]
MLIGIMALALAAGMACSRQKDESSPAAAATTTTEAKKQAPAPTADTNLAAADMGGAIEELTDNYGPGFMGRRLIDGLLDPTWRWAKDYQEVPYPQEAVISFFER